jgi:phosphoesterase RecJ-like protein
MSTTITTAPTAVPILRHVHILRSYRTAMNIDPSLVAEFHTILRGAHRVVIVTHVNPDGDAVGSALGTWNWLQSRGMECAVLLPNAAASNLQWMPGAEHMITYSSRYDQLITEADLILILDLNALQRLGELGAQIAQSTATLVNIDHHTYPQDFAHLALIDTEACSTCSLVAEIILAIDGDNAITQEVATCLYTGIMTDTGSFRFFRTTAEVFRLAALLISKGADPVRTYEEVINQSSFGRTRLLGIGLASMEIHADGQLCTMNVRRRDLLETGCNVDDVEGFVHHTLSIAGVRAGILFVEVDGEIKCSFRSKGDTGVRDLAAKFGGGGHVHAAGARIRHKSFEEAVPMVTAAAIEIFEPLTPHALDNGQ